MHSPRLVKFREEHVHSSNRWLITWLTHPATHIGLGVGILLLDLWTGPIVLFPILFVIPVTLAGLFCSGRLAYFLAVLLPVGRLFIALSEHANLGETLINTVVRVAVLGLLAYLIDITVKQNREIKVLRGRLPICMWCKRIRNDRGLWEDIDAYVAAHSEADFSHGLCPECKHEHYGDLLRKRRTA